jgi:hypothetical protein
MNHAGTITVTIIIFQATTIHMIYLGMADHLTMELHLMIVHHTTADQVMIQDQVTPGAVFQVVIN